MDKLITELSTNKYTKGKNNLNPLIFGMFRNAFLKKGILKTELLFVNEDPPYNSMAEIIETVKRVAISIEPEEENDIIGQIISTQLTGTIWPGHEWKIGRIKIIIGINNDKKFFLKAFNIYDLLKGQK